MTPLHVATPTVQRELPKRRVIMKAWLHFMWLHQQFKEIYLKDEIIIIMKVYVMIYNEK